MPCIAIHDKHFESFISKEEIKDTVYRLAKDINRDYYGRSPLMLVALKGAFVFASDLLRRLTPDHDVAFIQYNSYQGTESSSLHIKWQVDESVRDRDVIIVEDIIDTGRTLDQVLFDVKKHDPSSVSVVSLLVKPSCVKTKDATIYYKGKYIQDDFVVGYGMDYNGKGRNLKQIYRAIN